MIIFPAIDLLDGKAVRLQQGDFKQLTVYSNNPLEVAKQYQNDGATWLHVIDLDGAQTGTNTNLDVIQSIVKNTNLLVQVGGGIRDLASVERVLSLGVERVIVGTLAVNDPVALEQVVKAYPGQVIVSVDSKDGFVSYSGWQDTSSIPTLTFCRTLEDIGIDTIVYTDISKDGMMEGPNMDDYEQLKQTTNLNLIASGGVSTLSDITELSSMKLYGAIIGKALYINAIKLKEAIRCSQDESSPV